MAENEFPTRIIRGTNSDFDDLEVIVGPTQEFFYVDPISTDFRKKIVCRPVVALVGDDEGFKGIWLEEEFLKFDPPEGVVETTVPGEHFRTFNLIIDTFELTLVEYSDRLQISVVEVVPPDYGSLVLLSVYKERKHFGSIKFMMDECQTEQDILEFIEETKQL